MLFNINDIRSVGLQQRQSRVTRGHIKKEIPASEICQFDIFLSHSFNDLELIRGLHQTLERFGFSVYVDWIDDKRQLDRRNVTPKTAEILKQRMKASRCLFFAATENSPASKWMPWELGYFDGYKDKVAILPVVEHSDTNDFKGAEYLGLYPYITHDDQQLRIHKNENKYEPFREWLMKNNQS